MGFRSGEYGGRYRNQHPISRKACAASLFRWVARLSQMTTVPACSSGARTSRMYAAKASPSIAPLITHGAIRLLWVRPAINVCVPHDPKGAFISSRRPRMLRPRRRVRLVLTEVSSMNTSLSAWVRMSGMRCWDQSCRKCLTRARSRSVATSDFFCKCIRACAGTDRWTQHALSRLSLFPGHLQVQAT